MAQKKTTNVVFVLDETGSMESCKRDTIGGFNNFLKAQKKSGNDIRFSLTLFNSSKIDKRHVDSPISEVRKLSDKNYSPSHMTPLWDAVGSTIGDLPKLKDVLFCVLTDGYENCSKEFTSDSVRKIIEAKEKKGWKFMFLGADLSNFEDAQKIGVNLNFNVDSTNMKGNLHSFSDTVSNYCSTGEVVYKEPN